MRTPTCTYNQQLYATPYRTLLFPSMRIEHKNKRVNLEGKAEAIVMKLQVAVVLLLPVLFSTTDSPSHIRQIGASPRRSRWCIQSQVVSCLDPYGSLPLPSMNHTTVKLLSDLPQLINQPVVRMKMMENSANGPIPYKPMLVHQLLNPVYLITILVLIGAIVGAMLCIAVVITLSACGICSTFVHKLFPKHKSYSSTMINRTTILKEKHQGRALVMLCYAVTFISFYIHQYRKGYF